MPLDYTHRDISWVLWKTVFEAAVVSCQTHSTWLALLTEVEKVESQQLAIQEMTTISPVHCGNEACSVINKICLRPACTVRVRVSDYRLVEQHQCLLSHDAGHTLIYFRRETARLWIGSAQANHERYSHISLHLLVDRGSAECNTCIHASYCHALQLAISIGSEPKNTGERVVFATDSSWTSRRVSVSNPPQLDLDRWRFQRKPSIYLEIKHSADSMYSD